MKRLVLLLPLLALAAAVGCRRAESASQTLKAEKKSDVEINTKANARLERLENTVFVWPDWEENAPHFTIPGSVKVLPRDAFAMGIPCVMYSIKDVELQPGVEAVEPGAFDGAEMLEKLVVPASCTNLTDALAGCEILAEIVLDPANPAYKIENGLLLSRDGRELVYALRVPGTERVVVPNGVERIDDGAFGNWGGFNLYSRQRLVEVVLPASVREIGNKAFSFSRFLERADLPERLVSIGDRAFERCEAMESVTFPENLQRVGEWAFCQSGVRSVSFADGIRTTCGKGAFSFCVRLERIELPAGVAFESAAFENCGALLEAAIAPGVTNIPDRAFEGCGRLVRVALPEGLRKIGYRAFANCDHLAQVDLPKSLREIESSAFEGCASLSTNVVPVNVESIGFRAFARTPMDEPAADKPHAENAEAAETATHAEPAEGAKEPAP